MAKTTDALDLLAEQAVADLAAVRPSDDPLGAAVAAAALASTSATEAVLVRDRMIRIARSEGATLRALASATGLSHQTIANICKV